MRGNYKFWNRKKILITGHKGFLGSWVAKKLLEFGAEVVGVDIAEQNTSSIFKSLKPKIKSIKADVANLKLVNTIIGRYRPKVVFHLAAQAIVGDALREPVRTFKSNVEGTWNILEVCRNKKFVEAIVVASSDKAYGDHKILPYREEAPLKGDFPYDVSKSCTDLLVNSYFKTYGLPVCTTRCGNIFGPGDLHFSRIVPDAIRSIFNKQKFDIRSDGKFVRDYIYVEDVALGYILLAEKMKKLKLFGQPFNFSDEKPVTVLKLFSQIAKIYGGYNLKPNILNKAKYEIKCQYLSSKKAKKILGWKPKHTLGEALGVTIDWYKEYFGSR